MGISPFRPSSASSDSQPSMKNHVIEQVFEYGRFVVVRVCYPHCTNYEGKKILVFLDRTTKVLSAKYLDPHFTEDVGGLSPFARFEPTERGWEAAKWFVKAVTRII